MLLKTTDSAKILQLNGSSFRADFDKTHGKFTSAKIHDGDKWHDILSQGGVVGDNLKLPVISFQLNKQTEDSCEFTVVRQNNEWRVENKYEVYASGWIISSFSMEVIAERAQTEDLFVGIDLDENTVFANFHRTKFTKNDQDERESIRAMALDFSTDSRAVTNSINVLLESVTSDIDGRACRKVFEKRDGHRFMGWKLSSGWRYPFRRGFRYENRWAITLSGLNNQPNPIRGQRIYHYYGYILPYPASDIIEEMAEYGCSILILHNAWKYIGTCIPMDKNELKRVVAQCREHDIKILPYTAPYLISHKDPAYPELHDKLTDCMNVWYCGKDSQLSAYEPHDNWDCDELCLRCPEAFDFMIESTIGCVDKFGLDGIYVDFCWPAQGLCNDATHDHKPGLFNFYDFFRLNRAWRQKLGKDKLMIGHGGGFIVASDMIEGYDACLTGEAQLKMSPETIGQQFGTAPTLWTIQSSKGEVFRSHQTIEEAIREGVTVHYGVGIGGSAVIATLDPAHHREMIAFWQIFRAFPIEKATYYNYLYPAVLKLDNPEILYSLYVTEDGCALLIIVNGGGRMTASYPCVGCNISLDLDKLGLSNKLNCVELKGSDYQSFRMFDAAPVRGGKIFVPEIGRHEFIGFVLSPGDPPDKLTTLRSHLETRNERLSKILKNNQTRQSQVDKMLAEFHKSPLAQNHISYEEYTRGRTAE
jgi:uncharacterized protein DUF6259